MNDLQNAAKQLLSCVDGIEWFGGSVEVDALEAAVEAVKASLAQQEQAKPVGSIYITSDGAREVDDWRVDLPVGRNLLYTAPPTLERKEHATPWRCACGANLYIDAEGRPASKTPPVVNQQLTTDLPRQPLSLQYIAAAWRNSCEALNPDAPTAALIERFARAIEAAHGIDERGQLARKG